MPRELRMFFLGSAPFTKWRKAGMLRLAKINIRKEKRPYVARKMCATQGLKFLSNLGLSQAARFCPFDGFRGCERFPKTNSDLVWSLYIIFITLATPCFLPLLFLAFIRNYAIIFVWHLSFYQSLNGSDTI